MHQYFYLNLHVKRGQNIHPNPIQLCCLNAPSKSTSYFVFEQTDKLFGQLENMLSDFICLSVITDRTSGLIFLNIYLNLTKKSQVTRLEQLLASFLCRMNKQHNFIVLH